MPTTRNSPDRPAETPLLAVDIGNTRIKLGRFPAPSTSDGPSASLPTPDDSLSLAPDWNIADLTSWLDRPASQMRWLIASVERASTERLLAWLEQQTADVRQLTHAALPLQIDVEFPARVGMDRLVNAVAANQVRRPDRPALVIDVGTAIKVDAVSAAGVFLGGAILPGIAMSAAALHQCTDRLPRLPLDALGQPPSPLGKSTESAIHSGIFWGAIGAIRELTERMGNELTAPELFLTGGAAPTVGGLLQDAHGAPARYIPHLTLAGIAVCAHPPAK